MLFTSLNFFIFLGLVLIIVCLVPNQLRWLWLLVASYFFYASWEFRNIVYIAVATLVAYVCGRGIAKANRRPIKIGLLIIGLVINLGMLVAFKYYDFLSTQLENILRYNYVYPIEITFPRLNLLVPVGLSFFTFSIVTYLVDVYVGKMAVEGHVGKLALYVAFFPKVFAGPIERARTFLPQLHEKIPFNADLFHRGAQLILWGVFKKVVIADNLAIFVDKGFGNPTYSPPIDLIIATYFFAFQIYCDFSGYTDIAIGVSNLMGYDLMENFRRPYLSRSTAEFWARRWHISLASWFRDYMYIPLGGNRRSRTRHYVNIMGVFVVSGLWHAGLGYGVGGSFLIWGALNGLYQWVSMTTARYWHALGNHVPRVRDSVGLHVVRVLFTFHLITFAWIFFRADSVSDALTIIQRIAMGLWTLPRIIQFYPFTHAHLAAVVSIAVLLVIEIMDETISIWEKVRFAPRYVRWTVYYVLILSLLLFGEWETKEFIYMQF